MSGIADTIRPFVLLVVIASGPVSAETLSYTWEPVTEEQADALRLALTLHALSRQLRDDGSVRQRGKENVADLAQDGLGNWGAILQRGRGHEARLEQSGYLNGHILLQAGRGASAVIEQDGDDLGVTLQFGW